MKKIIFIGSIGAGKTTLSQALLGEEFGYEKTQQVLVRGNTIIDTPGEFLDIHGQKGALWTSSAEAEVVGFVQSATDVRCMFPPCYSGSFAKDTIGIVTKIDQADEGMIRKAMQKLNLAGVPDSKIFFVNGTNGEGTDALKEYLKDEEKASVRSNNW